MAVPGERCPGRRWLSPGRPPGVPESSGNRNSHERRTQTGRPKIVVEIGPPLVIGRVESSPRLPAVAGRIFDPRIALWQFEEALSCQPSAVSQTHQAAPSKSQRGRAAVARRAKGCLDSLPRAPSSLLRMSIFDPSLTPRGSTCGKLVRFVSHSQKPREIPKATNPKKPVPLGAIANVPSDQYSNSRASPATDHGLRATDIRRWRRIVVERHRRIRYGEVRH
jgi:hypothetical protein